MAKRDNRNRGVFIRRTKTGTSYGIDYVHPSTGQRVRKILPGVKSENEALKLRGIELTDAQRGLINQAYNLKPESKAVSFESVVEAYLNWSKEHKRSWQTDSHRAKPFIEAFQGKLLSDINPFMIEKYKMNRAKTVSKKTVNKELSFARQAFEKAIEWGKFDGANPFAKVQRFKIHKGKKPGYLKPEQVQAIMEQIAHPVKRDMVEFDFYTGWRISEIRKLKWTDVDLVGGYAWIVDPKGGDSVKVELNNRALEIIEHQERRSEWVFCHKNGRPFKTNLHKAITGAADRAGVDLPPRKAWHIFRRTWASMMLQAGCDVETLRVLGNWKDYSMPMWYADAAGTEHKKGVLNRLPELENGTKKALSEKVIEISSGDS